MKFDTKALKAKLAAHMFTTSALRREATRCYKESRHLHSEARQSKDVAKKAALKAQAEVLAIQAQAIFARIPDPYDRRCMMLALAMANGTPYILCEPPVTTKGRRGTPSPKATDIAAYLKLCLPYSQQQHAQALAEAWLTKPEFSLKGFEADLGRRIEIEKIKRSLTEADQNISRANRQVESARYSFQMAERGLASATKESDECRRKRDEIKARLDELEAAQNYEADHPIWNPEIRAKAVA